eukprot:TRINITY_DN5475_c0_g2_i1.p1 TRINITY_DN5475_c0_g2~~TRINITY_DN5475_c0_g2_i1.p1  ORF type:complete len:457 (-),score=32.51 TRINITY_DN5475_c0_g2_i1:809-2179(-)
MQRKRDFIQTFSSKALYGEEKQAMLGKPLSVGPKEKGMDQNLSPRLRHMKVSNLKKPNQMIDDLHDIFSPISGIFRSQCGLTRPAELMVIQQGTVNRRKSHHKSAIDMIFVQKLDTSDEEAFPQRTILVKDAELFCHLARNLDTMLQQRGLIINYVPVAVLHRSKNLSLRLSNLILRSNLDTHSRSDGSPNGSHDCERKVMECLVQGEKRTAKWIKSISDLLKESPEIRSQMLPSPNFETRVKRGNRAARALINATDSTTLQCLTRLMQSERALSLQAWLLTKRPKKLFMNIELRAQRTGYGSSTTRRAVCNTYTEEKASVRSLLKIPRSYSVNLDEEDLMSIPLATRNVSMSVTDLNVKLSSQISGFSHKLILTLGEGITNFSALTSLNLDFTEYEEISQAELVSFSSSLSSLSNLDRLRLNFDFCQNFTDENLENVAKALCNSSSLTQVSLFLA